MDGERRAHPRFPLILAVQYLGAENVLDYTENLSAGGLFIRTERSFEAGERVTLVLSFPQLLEPVELQIEVVRRRDGSDGSPAGVAVRVPDDRPEDRARLADVARRVAGARHPDPSFRILLVEDNALVATMYAAALRRLSETEHVPGLGIEVASDGAAAFDRLLRAPAVDVVVTDVFMPIVSGITLVERIRAEPTLAHLPVVVITAGGEQERERLSGLGVSLFLRKPVSYQDLSGAVRSLLEGRTARPQAAPPREEARREALTAGAEVGTDRPDAKPASRR
ncbi:response regulator [Anaeromyxobacter dehalogenans]|uniref:Response regulator receiver domain protein (CheY-like) n=1 Tax=Anaeromyxobacter dehalogenans (strain 2CP-C) TaxID=290397 RepID=Q2IG04_ANADE|nr:response regulator [Anaeromyxobacter dehalogenans]ABC83511.1 response regulator receiver domain protein (CheY-like) [Anaeromyxobacter dehalogenans 2CP-C]